MKLSSKSPLQQLMDTLPQRGKVYWIGIRPARKAPLHELQHVEAITQTGLAGDHYKGRPGSKRQVTLIAKEHLDAVSSMLQTDPLPAGITRRNMVTQGINLHALKDKKFWVGDALLEYTGDCHPCSRMEELLGPGGYNAMRGHGGITARILIGGHIKTGDSVRVDENA